METIEHTLGGNPDFGRSSTVTILRNGDLAGRICLKVKLQAVSSSSYRAAWVSRLGHALLKQVEVQIGGSRIDRQYGVWMDVFYELTHTNEQERGYAAMIGDVPALTTVAESGTELPEYTLYIPLTFWFNRNNGLALPLIALQYHEVRLDFDFEDSNKLVNWCGTTAPTYGDFKMADASVIVDYIYLDSEERRRFAQVGHEYLIEQLQFTGVESVNGANNKYKLGFNHPCKEIVWALRSDIYNGARVRNNGNRFLAHAVDGDWAAAVHAAEANLVEGMLTTTTPASGCEYESISVLASEVGTVFCTTVETSASTSFDLYISFDCDGLSSDQTLYVITNALGTELIKKITKVEITFNGFAPFDITVANVESSITVADISLPVDCYGTDCRANTVNGLNPNDCSLIQLNYGLALDGTGNAVAQANIQLNGHDRFDLFDGNYFNYVQPHAHHTHTPADGINVYSFAIHPEQHQPSGTANLSRIDNTLLVLLLEDVYKTAGAAGRAACNVLTGASVYIWAVNYNVLRIMSGMGGLAYSN